MGINSITKIEFGAIEIDTWFTEPELWKISLTRAAGADQWILFVLDNDGLIGDVTFTVQEIDNMYLLITFNIEDMDVTPDNVALYVKLLDEILSMSTTIFNEGLTVNDVYQYPALLTGFERVINTQEVCKPSENPNDRDTCTFDQKRKDELVKAQQKFDEITGNEKDWSIVYDPEDYSINKIYLDFSWLTKIHEKPYLNFKYIQENLALSFD